MTEPRGSRALTDDSGHGSPTPDLTIAKDDQAGVYSAVAGDRTVGGVTFDDHDGRVMLLATSVFPQYRHRGIATELIRQVLDDVAAQGKTVLAFCPIVRQFIERNPGYAYLVSGSS
jgi:predicted GNAT family acetyltransferase